MNDLAATFGLVCAALAAITPLLILAFGDNLVGRWRQYSVARRAQETATRRDRQVAAWCTTIPSGAIASVLAIACLHNLAPLRSGATIDLSEDSASVSSGVEYTLPRRGVPIVDHVDLDIPLSDSNAICAWTTSFFTYQDNDAGPPGGVVDERLRVGGWSDGYASSLKFELPKLHQHVKQAVLVLYVDPADGGHNPTDMILTAASGPWAGKVGTHFLWSDRPAGHAIARLPAPSGRSETYEIRITDIVNSWIDGSRPNEGISLIPLTTRNNNFNVFFSTRGPPGKRPHLLITY
ncbi:MAG: hypothetical protein QOH86_980 [Sphingomonadales bacterium]|nr:hypothetical protein [Sphingomonadales bacterium]